MVIIFYDANKEQIYICTETDKTKIVSVNDPNVLDFVPNDDILYVSNAHFITKQQLKEWLSGDFEFEETESEPEATRFTGLLTAGTPGSGVTHEGTARQKSYIHPTSNGTVYIGDIHTQKYPDGITLNGKWHFLDIGSVEDLTESNHFKVLLAKGKIEIVPQSYVDANKHKLNTKKSPYQASLDKILIPSHIKAEAAAAGAWASQEEDDVATEIFIEG